MKINHIEIENYRNIESLSLDFDDINIIYGENAQGKTNIIEAIEKKLRDLDDLIKKAVETEEIIIK